MTSDRAPRDTHESGASPLDPGAAGRTRAECFEALNTLAGMLRRHIEDVGSRLGVTGPQARVLLSLAEPARMQAVADATSCEPSHLSGVAAQLEERGLVARDVDPHDRRARSLALTPEGSRLRSRLLTDLVATAPVLRDLDDVGAATLLDLLRAGLPPAL